MQSHFRLKPKYSRGCVVIELRVVAIYYSRNYHITMLFYVLRKAVTGWKFLFKFMLQVKEIIDKHTDIVTLSQQKDYNRRTEARMQC